MTADRNSEHRHGIAADRLRSAFDEACVANRLGGRLRPTPEGFLVRFDTQENAEGNRIVEAFVDEMRRAGADTGPCIDPSAIANDAELDSLCDAIRYACGRLRSLLVSHNSYVEGGFPYVFRAPSPEHARDGLSVTRYPADAACRVRFAPSCAQIDFEPGDLGEITSCGFYARTPLHGDYRVRARYRVREWRPGPETACFALFTMDEAQQQRYYAQRMSAADAAPVVAAHLANVLHPSHPAEPAEGQWKIERRGGVVRASHRNDGDWTLLGEHREPESAPSVVGAKIWGTGMCSGLRADVLDLEIEADSVG